LRCRELDSGVDLDPVPDHDGDDRPGQLAGRGVGLDLGQLPFQHRGRGALPEVRLEHRGERHPAAGTQRADAVGRSLRAGASHY
jgi:hypothetical protein